MIIYHNSTCSKSQCALNYLDELGIEYRIVNYLNDVPTKQELTLLVEKLNINPEELIRKNEDEYSLYFVGKHLTADEWIEAMVRFPKLIQRPIVVNGNKAIVARPVEKILELL